MKNQYLATLVKKHCIGENTFIFSSVKNIFGVMDELENTFIDSDGNKYPDFEDDDLTATYYFNNLIKLNHIKQLYPGENLHTKDIVRRYAEDSKKVIYIVHKNKGMEPTRHIIKIDDLINADFDDYDFDASYESFIENIENGSFTIRELKQMKTSLEARVEKDYATIETICLHIDEMKEAKYLDNSNIINVNDVFKDVTKTLIGQDNAARRLITEIAKMETRGYRNKGILLTGSTGVGKTKLVSLVDRYIDRPFLKIDSTQLTVPGYVGKDIEEYLWELYLNCDSNIKKAERAIIFFDEIDKKGSSDQADKYGRAVLNMLLKFMDGTTYVACENMQHKSADSYVPIKTNNMLIILGGAFTSVYKSLNSKKEVGFNNSSIKIKKEPTIEDFVEQGLMPDEFMGRCPIHIHLDDLTEDTIKRIITESDESPLKLEEETFAKVNAKLTVTENFITGLAKQAYEKKSGARGLDAAISDVTWRPFDDVSSNIGKYKEVILDENTLNDPKVYTLIPR